MKLYTLNPHFSHKIWGGTKLVSLKKIQNIDHFVGQVPLGETWEVSRHKEGKSVCKTDGTSLDQIFTQEQLSYLIKFIDTSDNLSVQVHPGDEYAAKVENDNGKTECWVILSAGKDCGIYLGLKPGINKLTLQKAIEENKEVNDLLNFIPVKPGDFFVVEAGTIHAIGANVLMCEIQQSSGVTYRVWDWNRVDENNKPRTLHVDKAMDVINFSEDFNSESNLTRFRNLFETNITEIFKHKDFNVNFYHLNKSEKVEFINKNNRAVSLIVFEGEIEIENTKVSAFESIVIKDCLNLIVNLTEKAKFIIVS